MSLICLFSGSGLKGTHANSFIQFQRHKSDVVKSDPRVIVILFDHCIKVVKGGSQHWAWIVKQDGAKIFVSQYTGLQKLKEKKILTI